MLKAYFLFSVLTGIILFGLIEFLAKCLGV